LGRVLHSKTLCIVALGLLIGASPGEAKVFYTRPEALQLAFPQAERVETETFILGEKQVQQVQEIARTKLDSKLATFYVGIKEGKVLGYAFIDNHIVRTLPEALVVVLSPDGVVQKLHVLAFYEPLDYLPSERWLKQFAQKTAETAMRLGWDIHGIAGSTLTARAITKGVRKVLALYQVLIKDKE
jgi:hypothetical protein